MTQVLPGAAGDANAFADTPYLEPVRCTLDALIEHGTDRYGRIHSPIWMSILHVETLRAPRDPLPLDEDARVQRRGRRAPGGSNLFLDQAMLRAARRLSALTNNAKYEEAAKAYVTFYLGHFIDPLTGLIEWGPHNFIDAFDDAVKYLEGHQHEIHGAFPFWPLLHTCAPEVIEREIAMIWEWHINHETAECGRHPDRGEGCSFAMTAGEFIAAFGFLHQVTGRPEPVEWAVRAARVHWDSRNPETGLFPNQAERQELPDLSESQLFWRRKNRERWDSWTADSSIPGLWCSRLLAASLLMNHDELRDMAVATLKTFLRYQWQNAERPWGQLNLDGSVVPGPRVPVPAGVPSNKAPYEVWAPRGPLDLWPAYYLGYEYPQRVAQTYAWAARLTGDAELLEGARRWGRLYAHQADELEARGGTYAQNYGTTISFFVELFHATGERAHLDTARTYADQAVSLLFTGKIFRGHPAKPYYEAVDGVGFLCYGLPTARVADRGRERPERPLPLEPVKEMHMATNSGYVEQVRPGVLGWLQSVRWPDEGWGRWKYNRHMARRYGLQSSAMAIQVLNQLGALASVSAEQKQEAVAFFRSTQDPKDGYFKDPLVTDADRVGKNPHSWEAIYGQWGSANNALKTLGGEPLYPLPEKSFADLRTINADTWTRSLDWTNPWRYGEDWSRAIEAFVRGLPANEPLAANPTLTATFEAFEQNILDPATGMPTEGGCADRSCAMAGLFKTMHAYLRVGRPVPHGSAAIDFTLGLQHDDGEFGYRRNMCINWDALWVLRELDKQLVGTHRHADIARAGNRLAACLLSEYRKNDNGFTFCGEHCWPVHHSIRISEPLPEGDIMGTFMSLNCLQYADEWNRG